MPCVKCFKQSKKVTKKVRRIVAKPLVKKVTFNDDVLVIYVEKITYDTSVCWERAARDRARFNRHIQDIEQRIGWVFELKHRQQMYNMICKQFEMIIDELL